MSDTLLIHYNIEDPDQASWALCNDAGELTSKISEAPLSEVSELATSHVSIILLDSQCLHINELQLPTTNLQKMLKAVPYAIEEFIAADVENLHFVVSKSNNSTCVVGIDKATLQFVINRFQDAGVSVTKIVPDALCLAANDQQWVVLNHKKHDYLQTATLNGIVVPHDLLAYSLKTKLKDDNVVKPEKILFFSESKNTSAFKDIKINSEEIELVDIVYNAHPLVVFCGNYKQAMPLNLLQHDFKPKSKSTGYFKHWRVASALAGTWLILHLGLTAFQGHQLEQDNIATKNQMVKIYKTAFPESRKINNPRRQMEQKLKELKSNSGNTGNGLLFLLAESFGTIKQDKKNITLQSLNFRNNRMEIGLDGANLQAIENLNKSLNSNTRIKSEITSSSSEKDKVKGNLRIEGRS